MRSKLLAIPLCTALACTLLLGGCGGNSVVPDSVTLPETEHTLLVGDEALGSFPLKPAAVLEGNELEGAEFSYEVEDPSVASVGKDGVVTFSAAEVS